MANKHDANSVFTGRRTKCPVCANSNNDKRSDNLVEYTDHWYCFACGFYKPNDGKVMTVTNKDEPKNNILTKKYTGETVALDHRRITEQTCQQFGYQTITRKGKEALEVANYYRDGKVVAQHLRTVETKKFKWNGKPNNVELFGQHLWKSANGKRLVITEGEIDALSVCQALGNTWPVVSIPSGSNSAVASIKANLSFVCSYQEIILCFDMDEPGRKAAMEVAEILPPGKCKIASLPLKDANDMLVAGKTKALVSCLWEASAYSPDEILHVSKVCVDDEDLDDNDVEVYSIPFDRLNETLIGQHAGQITNWVSGTGSGKSTLQRELIYGHLVAGRPVGVIMLEESPQETRDELITLMLNKPIRKIKAARKLNKLREREGKPPLFQDIVDQLDQDEYNDAMNELKKFPLYIYDHLSNCAYNNLMSRIEFMAVSLDTKVIVLDHITAAATGLLGADINELSDNERLVIDQLVKFIRSIAVRTGTRFDIVSQLKKTDKAFEEGERITLQDVKGAGSLISVPNQVIALERNRQSPDKKIANTTIVRVLKDRNTGFAGIASALYFDASTGRMEETMWAEASDGDVTFPTLVPQVPDSNGDTPVDAFNI